MEPSNKQLRKQRFYALLDRVEGVLHYFGLEFTADWSNKDGGYSCYLTFKDLTIRVSDHGDKRHNFMYNFRTYKSESDLAQELLVLRKFIRKARKYGLY